MKLQRGNIICLMFLVLICALLSGCKEESSKEYKTKEAFEQAKVGVLTGSSFDRLAKDYLPAAEKVYCMNMTDLILSLKQDKINGILMDKGFYVPLIWEEKDFSYIEMDNMSETEYAVAFPKAESSGVLKKQIDEFICQQKQIGELDKLASKWIADVEPDSVPDMSHLDGRNGVLKVAVSAESKPFTYIKDGKSTGFDIELLVRFAEEYGYSLDIDTMDFGALLAGITAERYDLAVSGITVTEERKESVLFSESYYQSPIIMTIMTDDELSVEEFSSAKMGILTGSSHDKTAKEYFPNAERVYYKSVSNMILAVEQGKIDCYLEDEPFLVAAIWEGAGVVAVDHVVKQVTNAFVFRKSEESNLLKEELNVFLTDAKTDGTLERLKEKWLGDEEPTEHPDYDSLTGERGTIRLAVGIDSKPMVYQYKDQCTGFEIELLTLFARKYGYAFDISYLSFDSIIAGVAAGKYDMAASAFNITEERKESVDFSESYGEFNVIIVTKSVENEEADLFAELKESFEKTFIREDRWKLIVNGVGVTVLISICSVIAGSILGFLLYMLGRSDSRIVKVITEKVAKIYSRIIAGTPSVVVLMILFYVVFGSFKNISGVFVAIIGFSLTFGAFVYDHMIVSVDSVDRGQTEAAYALGYTKNKAFFRIIFPQSMRIFLPSYCAQAVELVKATAIVGYIAVNDLTKMGDIIRSNTYEAFFPLIATALIYFMLTWGLTFLLNILKKLFEPKQRKYEKILKGLQ